MSGAEFRFWLVADTWLAFFFVALLREELVPYFLYYCTWTVYFDLKCRMNEILLYVLYLLLLQRTTTHRSPLLRFEGFRQHFYGFPREAVAVQASAW